MLGVTGKGTGKCVNSKPIQSPGHFTRRTIGSLRLLWLLAGSSPHLHLGWGHFIIQESNTTLRWRGRPARLLFLPPSHAELSVPKASGQDQRRGCTSGTVATLSFGGHSGPRGASGDTKPLLHSWWAGNEGGESSPRGGPTCRR